MQMAWALILKEKLLQTGEVVHAEQVHPGGLQLTPECRLIGRGPETETTTLLMRLGNDLVEIFSFLLRHRIHTAPFENGGPIVADQGNEVFRRVAVEITQSAIDSGIAKRFRNHEFPRAIPRDDDDDGF